MLMPGRTYSSDKYRYGFNGQERSTELGSNTYNADYWQYDSRIGRRWNIDPKSNPGLSSYSTFSNNPIFYCDPLGDTSVIGAGGSHSIDIDEKNNTLEFYNSNTTYTVSGTQTKVPVKPGQLRSFTNEYGTFSARWNTVANGVAVFEGYKNDDGKDLEAVIKETNELLSSWKFKLLSFGDRLRNEHQKDPVGFTLKVTSNLLMMSAMQAVEPVGYSPGYNPSVTFTEESASLISTGPYANIRAVSSFLIGQGVPRAMRIKIINSFEIETIALKAADNNTFGLRFFDNINAFEKGRYLFPTFTNSVSRNGLALPYKWNNMTNLTQFQIRPGSPYIFGRAGSQGNYTGGAYQMYVPNINNLIK